VQSVILVQTCNQPIQTIQSRSNDRSNDRGRIKELVDMFEQQSFVMDSKINNSQATLLLWSPNFAPSK
jgi:uncharacterized membrane protein affecting hemolysin expression